MTQERFCLTSDGDDTKSLHAVTRASFKTWLETAPQHWQQWLKDLGFKGEKGKTAFLPEADGSTNTLLVGLGDEATLWSLGSLPNTLPPNTYSLELGTSGLSPDDAALGWALGAYKFTQFKSPSKTTDRPQLLWPEGSNKTTTLTAAEATYLARDLINRPANDLTTAQLGEAAKQLAETHGASFTEIIGEDLLAEGYPAIHVVGRANETPPRLLDIRWGDESHPKLTIVGKGIVFDTGGLDLKPSSAMRTMKKDMGGAAHAIGLAHMIMATNLPVRLRVLLPTAENSVSERSYRPSDVIQTRKGLTVEIGNTDAEGRLVLADALHEAASEEPEAIIDFATLTGAARVALGTELPALFCNDDTLADQLLTGGKSAQDQLWRMPLHAPYKRHLKSAVADISSTGDVPTGGAITAALFLERFVEPKTAWAHLDVMAWNTGDQPGRPKGGEAMGMRGIYEGLKQKFAP